MEDSFVGRLGTIKEMLTNNKGSVRYCNSPN
jgi:hypothetical protein